MVLELSLPGGGPSVGGEEERVGRVEGEGEGGSGGQSEVCVCLCMCVEKSKAIARAKTALAVSRIYYRERGFPYSVN